MESIFTHGQCLKNCLQMVLNEKNVPKFNVDIKAVIKDILLN